MSDFKQYEFEITRRDTGKRDQMRATAADVGTARQAVQDWLGGHWEVSSDPIATRPPHQVFGEIDCT